MQNERVLKRLKRGPLTQVQALDELGVMRLGARVHDLRRQGHKIKTETVVVTNRFDERCKVAKYRLERKAA